MRGPLHGIPIALKDNIHTTDMPTTGGAMAFEGYVPPYDATLTAHLREAGAVILAKTVLTELANFIAAGMPGNYSGLGGYGLNPYDPRRDPRDATGDGRPAAGTGGSSSGIGTAANFWAANVGTETSGSILSPSNQNMLAGIKPTVGRISRYGVIPITADQDTAGPMAKYVADAAVLLGAMEGAAPDPHDAATSACTPPPNRDYTVHLKRDGLKGARIGIPRAFYFDKLTVPGEKEPRGGLNETQAKAMADAIAVLKAEGAEIVDPADIPSVVDPDAKNNFLAWGTCSAPDGVRGKDANCSTVLKYGMKRDFNAWLASLGAVGAGEDAGRAARLEHRPRQPRRHQVRAGATSTSPTRSNLERDKRPLGGRPQEGHRARRDARHRRGDEGAQARRDPLPGRQRRRHRRQARLSDGDRAVRAGRQRADAGVPRGLRGEGPSPTA